MEVHCDLGLLIVDDSRCDWNCNVWVFASHVFRLESQSAARFGRSECA